MSTPNESTTVTEAPVHEPFPETNTMPSGWDVSGLTIESAPAPSSPAGDAPGGTSA